MILAIELIQVTIDENLEFSKEAINNYFVHTQKIATFESEYTALEFAEDKPEIILIDTESGKVIKDATLTIEVL